MFDTATIDQMRDDLLTLGSTTVADANGRRLYFVHTKLLRLDTDGLVVAYEGYGAYTFELDRPVNEFRLAQAGFPFQIAKALAGLINQLTRVAVNPVANTALSGEAKATLLLPSSAKVSRKVKSRKGEQV